MIVTSLRGVNLQLCRRQQWPPSFQVAQLSVTITSDDKSVYKKMVVELGSRVQNLSEAAQGQPLFKKNRNLRSRLIQIDSTPPPFDKRCCENQCYSVLTNICSFLNNGCPSQANVCSQVNRFALGNFFLTSPGLYTLSHGGLWFLTLQGVNKGPIGCGGGGDGSGGRQNSSGFKSEF